MDNVVRKKCSLIVCIVFIMSMLCSCNIAGGIAEVANREKEIKLMAEQVMKCIVDKNKTELLLLYSPDQINNHKQEIYDQMDSAFKFINGKIISYDYAGKGSGGEKTRHGKTVYLHCIPEIRNVVTDTGFEYTVEISVYPVWKEEPERKGIARIRIIDAENYNNRVEMGFEYLDD